MARMRRDRDDERDERDEIEEEDEDFDEDDDLEEDDDDEEEEDDRMSARVRKSVGTRRPASHRSSSRYDEEDDEPLAFTEIDAEEFMGAAMSEIRRAVRKSVQPLGQSERTIQRRLDRLTKSLGELAEQLEEMGEVQQRIDKALADLPETHKLVKSLHMQADALAKSTPSTGSRDAVQTQRGAVMTKGQVGEMGGEQVISGGIRAEEAEAVADMVFKALDEEQRLGAKIVTTEEYRAFQKGLLTQEQAAEIRQRLVDAQARQNGVAA